MYLKKETGKKEKGQPSPRGKPCGCAAPATAPESQWRTCCRTALHVYSEASNLSVHHRRPRLTRRRAPSGATRCSAHDWPLRRASLYKLDPAQSLCVKVTPLQPRVHMHVCIQIAVPCLPLVHAEIYIGSGSASRLELYLVNSTKCIYVLQGCGRQAETEPKPRVRHGGGGGPSVRLTAVCI